MRLKMIVFGLAIFVAGAVVASAQDPHMGTWKLNEAKSQFGPGATKNHTVVYEAAGDMTKVIVDGTDGNGNAIHSEWTGKFDRKFYPVTGDPASDTRSYRRLNNRMMTLTARKGTKVTVTGRIVVTPDGQSRTVRTLSQNAKGKWVTNIAVYDKQ
jgi:hypothetical protein